MFFGNKRVQVSLYEVLDNQKREREFLTRREVISRSCAFSLLVTPAVSIEKQPEIKGKTKSKRNKHEKLRDTLHAFHL